MTSFMQLKNPGSVCAPITQVSKCPLWSRNSYNYWMEITSFMQLNNPGSACAPLLVSKHALWSCKHALHPQHYVTGWTRGKGSSSHALNRRRWPCEGPMDSIGLWGGKRRLPHDTLVLLSVDSSLTRLVMRVRGWQLTPRCTQQNK